MSAPEPPGSDSGDGPKLSFGADISRVLEDYYTLGAEIGKGNFGTVHMATRRRDGLVVAVKSIKKTSVDTLKRMLTREIAIIKKLHHVLLVELYDIFETRTYLYLVMEYVSGGELFDYITSTGALEEATVMNIAAQLVLAIRYLHQQLVIHRDLKPENILLLNPNSIQIKIVDFGISFLAETMGEEFLKRVCKPSLFRHPPPSSGRPTVGLGGWGATGYCEALGPAGRRTHWRSHLPPRICLRPSPLPIVLPRPPPFLLTHWTFFFESTCVLCRCIALVPYWTCLYVWLSSPSPP